MPNLLRDTGAWIKERVRFLLAGGRNIGWYSTILPGTRLDYALKVGDRWRSSAVSIGIKWIVDSFPEARLCVKREQGDEDVIIPNHPLALFMRRPTPYYGYKTLIAGVVLSLVVDGNAYLVKIRNNSGRVGELWYLPHFNITAQWDTDTDYITRYAYTVNGQTTYYDVEDIVHIRHGIDPRFVRRGLSTLAQQDRQIFSDNEISTYHGAVLENFGVPGLIITPKDGTTISSETEAERIKTKLHARMSGDERGKPSVFGSPVDITPIGYSPQELMLDRMSMLEAERIFAAMGLDMMVAGLSTPNKTYSNYEEARRAAWQNAVLPLMGVISDALTFALLPEFSQDPSEFAAYDVSRVLALQEDMNALVKRLVLATGGAVMSVNEARRKLNLAPLGAEYDEIRETTADVAEENTETDAEEENEE